MDQLDEERLADNAVIIVPGTMGPMTTYATPYPFTDSRHARGNMA